MKLMRFLVAVFATVFLIGEISAQTVKTAVAVYDLQQASLTTATTAGKTSFQVVVTSRDRHRFTIPGDAVTVNGVQVTAEQFADWLKQGVDNRELQLTTNALKNSTVVSAAFQDKVKATLPPPASVKSEGFPRPMPAAAAPQVVTRQSSTTSTTVTSWQAAPTRAVTVTQTPTTVLRVAPLQSWWQSLPRVRVVAP